MLALLFGQDVQILYSHQQRGALSRSQSPSDMPSLAKVSSVHFTGCRGLQMASQGKEQPKKWSELHFSMFLS